MPQKYGLVGALGAKGGSDDLQAMLADRVKQALLEQQMRDKAEQQKIENARADKDLSIREQQLKDAAAERALAKKEQGYRDEATAVGAAINDAGADADVTELVTRVDPNNQLAQLRTQILRQKKDANIFPSTSIGGGTSEKAATAQNPSGILPQGGSTKPVGVSTRYYTAPAPARQPTWNRIAGTMAGKDAFAAERNDEPGFYDPDTKQPLRGFAPRPQGAAAVGGDAENVQFSPDAVHDTAMRYHLFGTSAIPARIGPNDRKNIINENAKINAALGQTPAMAIAKQLGLRSDAASLNRLTTLSDASRAAQAKAEPQASLIEELSNKVNRTQIPLLNRALLAGETQILGDTNATLLLGALTEFTAEYAKIVEGSANSSAGASVDSRRRASELVTAAMNKGTVKAQLAQMRQIMDWTIEGYDMTREAVANRMVGAGTVAHDTQVDIPAGALRKTFTQGPYIGMEGYSTDGGKTYTVIIKR